LTTTTVTVPTRRVNKVVFVLLCFFFGSLGVDRFMRGQVGLGLFKLLIGWWITFGIWPLVDFIVALVKLGKYQDEFIFDNAGRWVEPTAF
jgi:TM2 domain-containing membrane protein YozV